MQMAQLAEAAQARRKFQANLTGRETNFALDSMAQGQGPRRAPSMNPQEYADMAIRSGYDPIQAGQIFKDYAQAAAYGAKADGRQFGAVEFTDIPGLPGAKVVTRDGYTSVVQAPTAVSSKTARDPYAEIEFRDLSQQEKQLQKDLTAARSAKQFDKANQLYGQISSLRKRMERLRGNSASNSPGTPSSSASASSRYSIIEE